MGPSGQKGSAVGGAPCWGSISQVCHPSCLRGAGKAGKAVCRCRMPATVWRRSRRGTRGLSKRGPRRLRPPLCAPNRASARGSSPLSWQPNQRPGTREEIVRHGSDAKTEESRPAGGPHTRWPACRQIWVDQPPDKGAISRVHAPPPAGYARGPSGVSCPDPSPHWMRGLNDAAQLDTWRGRGWTAREVGQRVASRVKWKRRRTSFGGARTAVDGQPMAGGGLQVVPCVGLQLMEKSLRRAPHLDRRSVPPHRRGCVVGSWTAVTHRQHSVVSTVPISSWVWSGGGPDPFTVKIPDSGTDSWRSWPRRAAE